MKKRLLTVGSIVCIMPLLAACMITNQEIQTLQNQVRQNQKQLADLQKKSEEHHLRLEGLENSIQMIESRVEDAGERIEEVKARMAAESIPTIEGRDVVAPTQPEEINVATPGTATPATAAVEGTKSESESPPAYVPRPYAKGDDLYNSAYSHFTKSEFGQAILEFEEYVANYGKTELADNAQYWIGECYYAQKDYRQAIREFDKVEKNFPKGNKVPAAKLKKGLAHKELGNGAEGSRELKELLSRYPEAEEIPLAKEKLKAWK